MIGVKKNVIVFFGLFLVGMLFVPTGIPYMVPEAEAVVSTSSLSIGQHGTKNGGDCETVGTWVETNLGPEGGTCTLTTDIQITGSGVGLHLASSRVALDGAGHTVTGNQASGHDHIGVTTCNQCHTMVVKNLTIENFGYGLRSYNANGLTITGVTVENLGPYGIYINGVDSLLLENNIVKDSGMQVFGYNSSIGVGDGTCTGTGQYVSGAEWANAPIVIKNNQVSGGLYTSDGAGWCIDGNTVTNGSLHVSYAWDQVSPQNHIIKNNQVTGNTNGIGFNVVGSGNTFDSNTASGNRIGFDFDYRSQNNIITNNVANNNGDYGFYFSINLENVYEYGDSVPGSVGHTFTGNTASGNGVADIEGLTVPDTTPPTLAATANLNSTSTTGRTLHVTGNVVDSESDPTNGKYAEFTIEKGGVVQDMYASTNSNKEWQDPDNGKYCPGFQYSGQMNWHDPHLCIYNGGTLDMEIPVDWVSGTYDIVWNTFCNDSSSVPWDPCFTESSTSFSVPALPDTTNPVVTVPSNQNFSTTNSTGVMYYISTEGPWAANPPTITATDDVGWSGTSQQVIGLYQADQLSCIRSDGIALSGQPAMYHYTVGTTTVTCTATDAAGNTGTANFTVTVNYTADTTPSGTVTISSPITLLAADPYTGVTDPTGGDCTQIGTWDDATLTCTLTADVTLAPGSTTTPGGAYAVIYVGQTLEYISTTGITIDGAGHTITGLGTAYGNYGVWLGQTAQITVKNLVIENVYNGIRTPYADGITITGNTVNNPGSNGISVTAASLSTGLLVSDNTIQNGYGGIQVSNFIGTASCSGDVNAFPYWTASQNPYPVIIKDNMITGVSNWGMSISSEKACVDGNTIAGAGAGMIITGSGSIVSNNAVTDSTNEGIVAGGVGNTFDNNTSNGGGSSGFATGSTDGTFTNNVADNNAQYGFRFDNEPTGVLFSGNTATGNGNADFEGITILPTGPFTISDNATGGDCAEIGIWNSGSKTCTLTTDIVGSPAINQITIYDSGITLDGNGHSITGTYDATGVDPSCHQFNACVGGFAYVIGCCHSGVMVQGNNITIKNLTVKGAGNGVFLNGAGGILKNSMLDGNMHGFGIAGGSNNLVTENTIQNSLTESFTIFTSNNQIYNNNFIDDYQKGASYAANNIYNQEDPYGGNYYEHVGYASGPDQYGVTHNSQVYPVGWCQPSSVVDGAFCPAEQMVFGSSSGNLDSRPWITKDGWINFVPPSFTGPTVTPPSDITVSATLTSGTTVVYPDATATDNIAVTSGPTCDPASGTLFPVGTTTVTCTASDGHGNTGDATFTITITFTDTTPPTITVPADMSVSSISESGAAVTFDVTAADDVAVTTGPTCDPASGSTFPIGTTTVTCTASDAAGLTITDSFTVTLEYHPLDNTAPIITGLDDITLTTSNTAGAIATFTFSATDNVAVTTGPTCGVTSGSTFPVGETIVTCTASDDAGNTTTETFTVTVDLVPVPSINIQTAPTFFVDTGVFSAPVYYPQPTAASALGIASGPTCTPSSNSQFSVGSTLVTCTATDATGTIGTSTFLVTVLQQSALSNEDCIDLAGNGHDEDSVFVCEFPFNVTVEENKRLVWVDRQPWQGFYRHSITSSAGLFDHSDAGVMDMLPSAWGGIGIYSFYDKVNPSLTGSITIAESDTTNPTVTVPSDMTVSTDTPTGTPTITYSVSASDDREVTSGPTCTPASGTNFSVGTTTVTCSASDAAGNTGTSSFIVTVEYTFVDETPPGLVPPSGITLATTNPSGTVVTYTGVTATDNVAVTSGPTCTPASGIMFPIGVTTVTCTATDAAGNTGTTSFTVTITQTILDSSAPAITVSNNISQTTTSSSGKIVNYQVPTAVDNVGVTIGPTCTPASGYMFSVGITTVSCSASDAAGNTATASFTVTIINTAAVGDTIPPTLSQQSNIVQDMTLSNGAIVAYSLPIATDDTAVTFGPYCTPSSGSLFSIGTTTVTCIAKDAAGNQGSVSFNVIVTQPVVGEDNTVTLQLSKSSYFTGDSINITGVATGDTGDVMLIINAPDGSIISINQVTPESTTVSQSSGTQTTVQNVPGSSFEGCEPNCFLPNSVSIDAGGTVTWENPDNVPHTVTSGSPFTGPDGNFNSSLISAGSLFSHQFNASGTYDYYCIVHPWMQGSVVVGGSMSASAQPEESGSFTTQILTLGPLWSQEGSYTVNASYGPAAATKTFNFTVRELDAIPFTSVPSDIALSINKNNYTGDETISINVALIGGSAGQPISIQVSDPVGTALFLQTLNTDSQARINSQFTLPENVVSGTYTVSASSIGALWDLTDSIAFTGIPLEPEVLDSSISATDEQGEAVTTYNAGELGYFSTKMTTKSTSQILVTVSVFDAQQNTLGVGFFKTVLPKGDAEIVLGFEIPEGTISGDAQIFTNFFTDWPDQGGIPIGEEISSKVNIIGIEPVEEVVVEEVVVEEEPVQVQVIVQNAPGSSTPGCEETNSCFLPFVAEVDLGGIVTWENTDNSAHTATSGSPESGPSGHFDSTLMQVGDSFSHTFDNEGTYNYFCMVHPWMQGSVVVGGSDTVVEPVIEPELVEEVVEEVVEEEPMPESSGMQVTVQNAPGSSFEGCEPNCFLPSTVIIDAGGTVTWENPDDFPHTVTSGTSAIGPDGHFDSALIMTGGSFANTFAEAGTYNYFCMIHPWMEGKVVVAGSEMTVEPVIEQESSGMQVTVQNAPDSSFQGCEPDCFLPSTVTIDAGGTVTWENPDNVAHTTTSFKGSISGVIGLEWDSGLMLSGESFSHTFDNEGMYDYFCMVHPWMQGHVIVQGEEEEAPELIEEEMVEVLDILALNATSNIIQLSDAEYAWVDKPSLNDVYEKLTISSWVKPNFIPTTGPQYSAVSKEGSFDLFLTNTKEPTTSPGFSVYDGITWNTILIDSKVPDGWHHLAGVVDESEISLYLDSVLIGTKSIPPHYVFNDDGQSVPQTAYMATSENDVVVGALINSVNPSRTSVLNSFDGSISDVNIITDALDGDQISNLYDKNKDIFQRGLIEVQSVINGTVTTTFANTESPKLSAGECAELANEMELDYNDNHTLVCEFPFDVIIPLNSRILWIETLDLEDAPYHSIRSVDNIFGTGSMVSADMGFYDDVFTYGVYEYYDDFDESLTGKIIISKPTNNIDINEGTTYPGCADDYSCYDTFAAQVSVGEEITWKNQDTEIHTVTSGTPADGPDGLFDSGFIENYMYFYHTFDEPGTYDYFCMLHPWMTGKVVVGEI